MEVKLGRRIHVPLLMMLNCGGTFMEFIERNEVKMETGMFLDEDFPFYISYKQISDYRDSEVLSHWHIELEYILVLEGRLDYIGEDSEYTMSEGEGVLVNGNVLHSYRRNRTNECRYLVVIFHPSLIGYNAAGRISANYIFPYFSGDQAFTDIRLTGRELWHSEIASILLEAESYSAAGAAGYEMDIQILLLKCWRILYEKVLCAREGRPGKNPKNELIYKAVKYIREHIEEKIYLTDIARACSISNTECCRMFKRQVGQSPMEYVKKYRIKRSLDFLENKNCSIMQVAQMAGFESQSYYTKVFRSIMKCTPQEYRKENKRVIDTGGT